ncbi:MAG TPA: COX15/CtaA family protein, partial [Dehalococcoidia bacterium]
MTTFQRLALATTVATYILVVIGGTVRVTGSGLACPDWPTCNGSVIPSVQRTRVNRILPSPVCQHCE